MSEPARSRLSALWRSFLAFWSGLADWAGPDWRTVDPPPTAPMRESADAFASALVHGLVRRWSLGVSHAAEPLADGIAAVVLGDVDTLMLLTHYADVCRAPKVAEPSPVGAFGPDPSPRDLPLIELIARVREYHPRAMSYPTARVADWGGCQVGVSLDGACDPRRPDFTALTERGAWELAYLNRTC